MPAAKEEQVVLGHTGSQGRDQLRSFGIARMVIGALCDTNVRKALAALPLAACAAAAAILLSAPQPARQQTPLPDIAAQPPAVITSAATDLKVTFVNQGVSADDTPVRVMPGDAVRFTAQNAEGCEWCAVLNKAGDGKAQWIDGGLSITPKSGTWMPGRYRLRLRCARASVLLLDKEYEFWVEWDIDFAKPDGTYVQFMNPLLPQNARGQVAVDPTAGQLVLAPQRPDPDNPSYVRSQDICAGLDGYRIYLYYRVVKQRTGGFQLVLPGKLSLQVGDGPGSLSDCTIKVGSSYVLYSPRRGYYVDPHAKKRQAWTCRNKLASGSPLCIAYSGDRLEASVGVDASTKLFQAEIPRRLLIGSNRDITVRSYGSIVGFNRIVVRPYDWPPALN